MFEISVCSNVFCVFSLPLLFKLFPTPICSETKKGFVIIYQDFYPPIYDISIVQIFAKKRRKKGERKCIKMAQNGVDIPASLLIKIPPPLPFLSIRTLSYELSTSRVSRARIF